MIKLKQFDFNKLSNSIPKGVNVRKPFLDFLKNAVSVRSPECTAMTFFFPKLHHDLPLSGPINEYEALIAFLSIIIVADRLDLKIDHPNASDIVKFLNRLQKNKYKTAINEPWFSDMYKSICDVKDRPVSSVFSTFKNKFGLINCKGEDVCTVLKDLLLNIFNADLMNTANIGDNQPPESDPPKVEPMGHDEEFRKEDTAQEKIDKKQTEPKAESGVKSPRKYHLLSDLQEYADGLKNEIIAEVDIVMGTIPVVPGVSGGKHYRNGYDIDVRYETVRIAKTERVPVRLRVHFAGDPVKPRAGLTKWCYYNVLAGLVDTVTEDYKKSKMRK